MSEQQAAKKSDLGIRAISAVVMLAVAVACLWLGGLWLDAFIAIVAVATFIEFVLLVLKAVKGDMRRTLAITAGGFYIALAAWQLITEMGEDVFVTVFAVIGVDCFAYFAGRTFGGPKIAPSISPSKTWAGLVGGMVGAWLALIASSQLFTDFYGTSLCHTYFDFLDSLGPKLPPGWVLFDDRCHMAYQSFNLTLLWQAAVVGAAIAIAAQSGDFLESWIKRRAGVKDSSKLIPGHGGVFDRVDGLIAVAFISGMISLVVIAVRL